MIIIITLEKLIKLRKAIKVILLDVFYKDHFEVSRSEMNEYIDDKITKILYEVKIKI